MGWRESLSMRAKRLRSSLSVPTARPKKVADSPQNDETKCLLRLLRSLDNQHNK